MSKVGRPRKEIDWHLVEQLAKIHCTQAEIAAVLECDPDTIRRAYRREFDGDFAAAYEKWTEGGKASLRRAQWQAALKGNTALLIWLGKQVLGQRDQAVPTQEVDWAEVRATLRRKLEARDDESAGPPH